MIPGVGFQPDRLSKLLLHTGAIKPHGLCLLRRTVLAVVPHPQSIVIYFKPKICLTCCAKSVIHTKTHSPEWLVIV